MKKIARLLFAAAVVFPAAAPPNASAASEFKIIEVKPRIITAGSPGLNDRVIFSFAEPSSKLRLKIFSLDGRSIEEIGYTLDGTGMLSWDGKAGGDPVAPGVYIYQLEADNKIFNGTVVVAR